MPIIDLQRRLAPAGRIRIGEQVATANGKRRPAKLSAFRLTSSNQRAIAAVARLYGGDPHPWADAPTDGQWEVYTASSEIPVVIPPERMSYSQWYEQWSGGGCLRRCDGQTDQISDGPCACDPDKRECKMATRLSLMLAELPGIGLWTLATSGYYAGTELGGSFEIVQMLSNSLGREVLPGMLRLEERVIKRKGKTNKFAVPILDLSVDMASIAAGNAAALAHPSGSGSLTALPVPSTPPGGLRPVPVDETPPRSLPEQIAAVDNPPARRRRSNSPPALPATGIRPRTAEQVATGEQPDKNEDQPESSDVVTSMASTDTQARATGPAASSPVGSSKSTTTRKTTKRTRKTTAAPATDESSAPAWCRDLHIRASNLGLEDGQFRGVVSWVTNGRTGSTKELKAREASQVNEAMSDIESSELVVVERDGRWTVEASDRSTSEAS